MKTTTKISTINGSIKENIQVIYINYMGFLQVSKCPVYVNYKHSKDLNKWFIVIGIRTYKHFLYIFKRIKHEKL